MIGALRGKVMSIGENYLLLDVNGIGFRVFVPVRNLAGMQEGGDEQLLTHLVVREEEMSLYGFRSKDELDMFRMLLGVGGVGPKVAMSVMSFLTLDQILPALAADDHSVLMTAQGVGQKAARKIILELKDKAAKRFGASSVSAMPQTSSAGGDRAAEVIEALMALGYSTVVAELAVKETLALRPEAAEDSELLLRNALKSLAKD